MGGDRGIMVESITVDARPQVPASKLSFQVGGVVANRYTITAFVAAGGMGEVYAAHDAVLAKRVALKVLRPHVSRDDAALLRFCQEIRTSHQVTHPNVCRVFDVGFHHGLAFLTMEFVEGRSLRAWLAERRRGWREVLRVFVAAGRGLAAAHAAGLVHRDFKPDNVLFGDDGTVRVADFGLARLEGGTPLAEGSHDERPSDGVPVPVPLTRIGTLIGTPDYMAPEVLRRRRADARSDQFSFAVALAEALSGARPFKGRTSAELLASMGSVGRVAVGSAPRWVAAAVTRALARDPRARFRSVTALVDVLERTPQRRRAWMGGVAAACGVGGAFALALGLALPRATQATCAAADRDLGGAWGEPRRRAVVAGLLETGGARSAGTVAEAARALDRYAASLAGARHDACEAQRDGGESQTVGDLRASCLAQRHMAFVTLVDLLARADATAARNAGRVIAQLPDVADCADVATLLLPDALPRDPGAAARVRTIRIQLARARVLLDAGQLAAARPLIEAAATDARDLGHAPLEAEALYHLGLVQEDSGDTQAADHSLRASLLEAQGARHDALVARAAATLAQVTLRWAERPDEAQAWAELALATARRLGNRAPAVARARLALAAIALRKKQLDVAESEARQALALDEAFYGADALPTTDVANTLGGILRARGRLDDAEAMYQRALEVYLRLVGERHPSVTSFLSNLAGIAEERGQLPEAAALLRRAVDLRVELLGATHPRTADAMVNLAAVLDRMHAFVDSASLRRRALAIHEQALGPTHPRVLRGRIDLALTLLELGQRDEAETALAAVDSAAVPDDARSALLDAQARLRVPH